MLRARPSLRRRKPPLIDLTLVACILFAAAAVRATGLIAAAICLALTSALLALSLYLLDAPFVAVIELSVGAGLVAVLVVLTVVGARGATFGARPGMPRWLAVMLVGVPVGILCWMLIGGTQPLLPAATQDFAQTLWQERGLDALGQVVLLCVAAFAVRVLVGGLPGSDDLTIDESHPRSREVNSV